MHPSTVAPGTADHAGVKTTLEGQPGNREVVFNTQDKNRDNLVGETRGDDVAEEPDDDDDMSSETSEGHGLQEALAVALGDSNLSFKGSFYHSTLLASAPNPCLNISGLGLVGLPLSERDAQSIISCSNLAPFGHGERTVTDKTVRDTWEIEPSNLTFGNQEWEHYINNIVRTEVCKSLGVKLGNPAPKLELYKLLLYEKGSHFLPHQDTQKTEGMFATVIIILPSAYTGGQVVVSHASITKTIDFSQNSLLSTALLAWYTDVKHEVKEVTSGYRLALSYNLIHVAPAGAPPPALPDISYSVDGLRRVLEEWRDGKYSNGLELNLMAYLLNHEYSTANLRNGRRALKGVDAHRVTFIRNVAEDLGFIVGLASLEHNICGEADDCGQYYHSRRRLPYRYDNGGTPAMAEVGFTSTSISGLVDLEGNSLLDVGKLKLNSNNLIPNDPFKGKNPDETEYEGYMGNGAGQLDYWYRRTVLVIMHKDKLDDICFSAEGIPYAFQKLEESSTIPPTNEDRLWADRLLKKGGSFSKEHITKLMDYAFKWEDLTMWKAIMNNASCSLKVIDINLFLEAWQMFSFEGVCLSFEAILARSTQLPERINFISNLLPKLSAEEKAVVISWCQKELNKIISSYTSASVEDIPTILVIVQMAGLKAFTNIMMPNLVKGNGNYDFWIFLIRSLRESQQAILDCETTLRQIPGSRPQVDLTATAHTEVTAELHSGENTVGNLIKDCVEAAASQWSNFMTPSYSFGDYRSQTTAPRPMSEVDRIVEIIEEAISISDLNICKSLFDDLVKSPRTTTDKFQRLYNPLIPRLCTLLVNKNQDICSPPFVDFFQALIGLYLSEILGNKGNIRFTNLRKIGCGCTDCNSLDNFILDPTKTTTVFKLKDSLRTHIERQASMARDLCTYETIVYTRPNSVQVTKLSTVVEALKWDSKQKAAKAFLASIGPDDVIARIMGARYQEVNDAIRGKLAFGLPRTAMSSASLTTESLPRAQPSVTSAASAFGSPFGTAPHSSQASSSTAAALAPPVARPYISGRKRKSVQKRYNQ